jgi:hypothetical protein
LNNTEAAGNQGMQAAYVRSPMEYVIDQKVDFAPTIDWNLVVCFDEYQLINLTVSLFRRQPQGRSPNSQMIAVTVNATGLLRVAD